MTNIPDSGWLAVIHKVDWWVSAAIAVAAALVLALAHFDAPWFGQLPSTTAIVIGGVGILFFCLLVFRLIGLTYDAVRKRRSGRVHRGINKLSDQQREFLMRIFQRGSRNFELHSGFGSPRWFEELKNWKYIEWHSPIIWTVDTPRYYSITEDGWRQLEKAHSKSR